MASSKQLINSLLTEHFRYTPLTLVDEIINTVNEVVYRAVSALEEGLLAAAPADLGFDARAAAEQRAPAVSVSQDGNGTGTNDRALYPEAAVEIEEGVHKLETLLGAVVDRNFDKTEIYILRNILSVPEELVRWVRLSGYENLDFSPDPNAPTTDSLFALRRKAHETQRLQHALAHEAQRNAAVIAQLRTLLHGNSTSTTAQKQAQQEAKKSDLAFLTQTPAAQTLGVSFSPLTPPSSADGKTTAEPLTQHSAAAVAQLPALKELLAQLKPLLAAPVGLPALSAASEERREYIEAQARKQLERQGVNVETGDGLVGPSGVASGLGRGEMVGREEVESIEGVADALRRGNDSG